MNAIKNSLARAFSRQNLTQATTRKAIAGYALVAVLLFFSPTNPLTTDQMSKLGSQFDLLTEQVAGIIAILAAFFAALSKILATYHSIVATINLFHDEKKAVIVPTQPPKG